MDDKSVVKIIGDTVQSENPIDINKTKVDECNKNEENTENREGEEGTSKR